jgi:tetratricopeptide (TPR) repeat protein
MSGAWHAGAYILESELRRAPDHWPYQVLLAEIEDRRKSTEPAAPGAGRPEPEYPDSPEGWYLRSFATLDVHRALASAGEAVRLDADYVPALATLALLSPIAGDIRGALDSATKLASLGNSPFPWMQYKVEVLFGLSRFAEALTECDRIVEAFPEHSTGYLLRARTLRRMRRYAEAVRDFTAVIQRRGPSVPASTWLYYHRGTLHWMLGNDEEAISDYETAYRSLTYPTHANARLFFIRHHLGRIEEAQAALANDRERVWDDPWLSAILSCLAGELTPEQLVDAASGTKQQVEAYYYAGEVSLLHGRTDAAVTWFQACNDVGLDADPDQFWDPMSETELAAWRLGQLRR